MRTILVVDNDKHILTFMTEFLQKQGHEVLTAEDGLSALDLLREQSPDIIFTDLVMPNISGETLCRIIRGMPHLENAYLVVLSDVAAEQRDHPLQLDIDAQIAKTPLDELARSLSSVLDAALSEPRRSCPERVLGIDGIYSRGVTRELLAFKEHFEQILANMSEAVFEVTTDRRIVYVNPAALSISGNAEDRLLGGRMEDLFVQRERGAIRKLLDSALASRIPIQRAGPYSINRHKTLLSFSPLPRSAKKWVAILNDVTDEVELQAQLLSAQRMEAVGTLAAGIAHDFNNLLMNIQGNVSLMLWALSEDHPHYERLRKIEKQVRNGSRLTSQLLGYARKGRYDVRPTDLNPLIRESADTLVKTRKQLTFRGEFAADLLQVEADQSQMQQLFLNLFVNAADAMPQGGELLVQTRNTMRAEVMSPTFDAPEERYVTVSVRDTGCGMAPETIERVFEPFFTTKEAGKGTGLGLTSVYGIVKGHAGHIEVQSELGRGSVFTIHLPAGKPRNEVLEEAEEEASHIAQAGDFSGREGILLIDDEKRIRDVGRELLEALGYRVLTAGSGDEALELFAERRAEIDLVLLDMIMPGMSGGEIFDQLKERYPDVRVLLSSGYSLDGEAGRIMERGCNGFIQKPFRMRELSSKIREVLN
ncbi:ATP-binding response regulator [Desulfatiglans anilini]|uniref:ATP-binding response regulator n=1 Tax=Desulfatiglans anilini TaxID=90728 RepID=UPI0004155390|nr:response regulator [Desulfatiglans anilini]